MRLPRIFSALDFVARFPIRRLVESFVYPLELLVAVYSASSSASLPVNSVSTAPVNCAMWNRQIGTGNASGGPPAETHWSPMSENQKNWAHSQSRFHWITLWHAPHQALPHAETGADHGASRKEASTGYWSRASVKSRQAGNRFFLRLSQNDSCTTHSSVSSRLECDRVSVRIQISSEHLRENRGA